MGPQQGCQEGYCPTAGNVSPVGWVIQGQGVEQIEGRSDGLVRGKGICSFWKRWVWRGCEAVLQESYQGWDDPGGCHLLSVRQAAVGETVQCCCRWCLPMMLQLQVPVSTLYASVQVEFAFAEGR